ncbi:galactosyl transferase GMA12/MNN10 domain protein [Burkholderia latens]|uniref:Galactosyl transferase GMA12/MNN10 domain protein n=1 Tax=Burkholderia latens TaxID=488446 RepID=A0A6H9SXZ6_9BURK|nr:galactosyl transferase GMA12/MNN10 domain protein [Burkholderia latens]KAB0644823.1 galactosyl transferase GMA12/MNN10 domain protein [Burkholderia latens]VWB16708.1 galactosyl transferase GMA12/MNN10 domain protein [Burkholderia latens]
MTQCTVLSFFRESSPHAGANHARYASEHGYRHEILDTRDGPRGKQVQALHKYEYLLNMLNGAPEGHVVLVLTENAVIVRPLPLNSMIDDRDYLLIATTEGRPQGSVQIWRNTAVTRQRISEIAAHCRLGGQPFPGESALLAQLDYVSWHAAVDGTYVAMYTGPNIDPRWSVVPTFAISIEEEAHAPVEMGVVPRFRDTLFHHLAAYEADGRSAFAFDWSAGIPAETRSTFNPGRPIAFVTLYTPEIGSYAQIAEGNFRQYCERHGHTLYVHREIPPEIGLSGTGNWLKPWLLHAYLAHHEWVIWLDADVLIGNHEMRIEPLLEGADCMLARDIGQWPFNSGVMGFRRTEPNLAMLADLMNTINALPDRSGVYTGNGDQYYFIAAMKSHGLLDADDIRSPLEINTPWFFRRQDSFIVHYFGMWTQMRALMMDHDERERLCRTE